MIAEKKLIKLLLHIHTYNQLIRMQKDTMILRRMEKVEIKKDVITECGEIVFCFNTN